MISKIYSLFVGGPVLLQVRDCKEGFCLTMGLNSMKECAQNCDRE